MNKLRILLKVDTNARAAGVLFLMFLNVFILPFNLAYANYPSHYRLDIQGYLS